MDRIEHPAYLAVAALIGFFGNCVNTIVFLNFVPRWFDRNLGLGLGVVATGIGIGQMLAPLTASASCNWYDIVTNIRCSGWGR